MIAPFDGILIALILSKRCLLQTYLCSMCDAYSFLNGSIVTSLIAASFLRNATTIGTNSPFLGIGGNIPQICIVFSPSRLRRVPKIHTPSFTAPFVHIHRSCIASASSYLSLL